MTASQSTTYVVLEHENGVVLRAPAADFPNNIVSGQDLATTLAGLSDRLDGHATVAWYDRRQGGLSDPHTWGALPTRSAEIRHLGFTTTPEKVLRRLQAVAGEDPFVVPSGPVRVTWLLGAGAGVATVKALRLAGDLEAPPGGIAWRWARLGLRAFEAGIVSFHDSRLGHGEPLDTWSRGDVDSLIDHRWGRSRPGPIRLAGLLPPPAATVALPAPPRCSVDADSGDGVDAVIPTLGRPGPLADVLTDLGAQTRPPVRVLVIEQQPDGAASALEFLAGRDWPFDLRIDTVPWRGASRARNHALRHAASPWIALLDDDVRLPPGLLVAWVAEAEAAAADALSICEVGPENGVDDPPPDADRPPPQPVVGLGSGRALIRRQTLRTSGGFDERIEGWGEDVELALRLHHLGATVLQSRRLALAHLKAPRGGFRTPSPAKRRSVIQPLPAPVIAYRWLRFMPDAMLRGAVRAHLVRASRVRPSGLLSLPWLWLRWRVSLRAARMMVTAGPKLLGAEARGDDPRTEENGAETARDRDGAEPRSGAQRRLGDLVVVSHVAHCDWRGRLWSYAPYARELEAWADLFPRVLIAAPLLPGQPAGDAAPIDRANVHLLPQLATGGDSIGAKLRQLALLPRLARDLSRALRGADAVHVRCPGNLGLLGVMLAPLFSRRLVAKYAGQWGHYPGEAWSVRLQRALLRSPWWRGPVTVYGSWPDQPAKVVPFFTSVLGDDHLARARAAAARTSVTSPLNVLFVGRLSPAKNVDSLIEAVAAVAGRGVAIRATVIGDGMERRGLEDLAAVRGIADLVTFTGGVAFDSVLEAYACHDVLVLVSETEGWPKAITEAMAFGLIAIGSNRGLVPEILGDGRGLVIEPGDAEVLADHLSQIASNPDGARTMRLAAAAWGQRYTLGHLRTALGDLLADAWQVPRQAFADLPATPAVPSAETAPHMP